MNKNFELKPNKKAFINYNYLKTCIVVIISFLVFLFIFAESNPLLLIFLILILIGVSLFILLSLKVQFQKRLYVFNPERIIVESGGIFSDKTSELLIRNITHVTLVKPYFENKIFQTGHVLIELAGSANVEGRILSIDNPDNLYHYITKNMKNNGFKLEKKKLVQIEKPVALAAFFEVLKIFFIALFIIFLFIADAEGIAVYIIENPEILTIIILLVFSAWLVFSIPYYLDLKNRVYKIYDDTITYNEGFFTKRRSFIPIENLSDSELTQSIIDKIFSFYDIKISCQGAGSEINFKNMRNGPMMEKNIDNLINQTDSLIKTSKESTISKEGYVSNIPEKPVKNTDFTGFYKMDLKRTLVPSFLFFITFIFAILVVSLFFSSFSIDLIMVIAIFSGVLLPILIPIFVASLIRVYATKYFVNPKSIHESFNFLTQRNVEFSNDKITGIIFSRNFIDNWFNTFSIRFWSIGSNSDINFSNIKRLPDLDKKILSKIGITSQDAIYKTYSDFDFLNMIKANIFLFLLTFVLLTILFILSFVYANLALFVVMIILFLVVIVLMIYKSMYYRTSKLFFTKDYVSFSAGILFKKYYYALYDDIKDITTTRYPFSKWGSIKFNVAGESQTQKKQSKYSQAQGVSHQFKINYMPKIETKDELIDLIFLKRPDRKKVIQMDQNIDYYASKNISVTKPVLANYLFVALVVLIPINMLLLPVFLMIINVFLQIFLIFLLIFDFLIILYAVWYVKCKTYMIQPYRVLTKWGVLYKKQTSIIFTKIDHIQSYQGFINKLFKNGSITLHTIGSKSPELRINNISDQLRFYELIKKNY